LASPWKAFGLTKVFQSMNPLQMKTLQKHCIRSKFNGLLKWYIEYIYLLTRVKTCEVIM
jgi:hypothetical protein